jgi:hypothetical protein
MNNIDMIGLTNYSSLVPEMNKPLTDEKSQSVISPLGSSNKPEAKVITSDKDLPSTEVKVGFSRPRAKFQVSESGSNDFENEVNQIYFIIIFESFKQFLLYIIYRQLR